MHVLAKRILCMQRMYSPHTSSQSKVALRLWPTGQLAPRALYRALSGRRSVARAAVFVVNTTPSRGQTCDALSSAPKWRCLAESALKNPASTANKRRDMFGKRVSTFLTPSCNASVSLLAESGLREQQAVMLH